MYYFDKSNALLISPWEPLKSTQVNYSFLHPFYYLHLFHLTIFIYLGFSFLPQTLNPISLRSSGVWHTVEKLLMRATTLLQTASQSKVCMQNYGPPKSREPQLWEFWDSHLGVPRQNDIWVLVPWLGTENTIRGKVVASPKSGLWWVLWIRVCSWFVYAPKCSNYALTNLLFGLCRSVWMIEMFVNQPSPILEL
jgi:hypothetical protein